MAIQKTLMAAASASLAAVQTLVDKYNLPKEEAYEVALNAHTVSMQKSYEEQKED